MAGTVLAVAATLLAVFGAIAVAYLWTNLNEKVDLRVNEQVKIAIEQALKEQEAKISERTSLLLLQQHSRNLLYTGLTRAKQLEIRVGPPKSIGFAVKRMLDRQRYTSLADRLKQTRHSFLV